MAKSIVRIFWLLIGLAGIGFGGYTLYRKQYFPISHASFIVEQGTQLFIPNLNNITKKENGLEVVTSYAGDQWTFILNKIGKNVPAITTVSISQSDVQNSISFDGLAPEIMNDLLGSQARSDQQTVLINGEALYYWQNGRFLVFSTAVIHPKVIKLKKSTLKGNADFFYLGEDGIAEAIKLTKQVKFSAYMTDDDVLKGKALNAKYMLSICPLGANLIKYYGSTRFLEDAATLQGADSVNHLSWVNNELLYMQKDSFEVVAGIQNDGIQLRNMLLEAVSEKLTDTVIVKSIYFNNTEIIPFNLDWPWQTICTDLKTDLRYFASYNNFVFMANNLQAMYWLLKSIQLGKTHDAFQLKSKIPARVNLLTLQKTDNGTAISSKTWVSRKRSINLAAMTNKSVRSNNNQLISEFSHVNAAQFLLLTTEPNNQQVLSVTTKAVQAYSLTGDEKWQYVADKSITVKPLSFLSESKLSVVAIADGNRIKIIDSNGQLLLTMGKMFSDNITNLTIHRAKEVTQILASNQKTVAIYNPVNGAELMVVSNPSSIKSTAYNLSNTASLLSVFYQNDSVKLYDVTKQTLLVATSKSKLAGRLLPAVQGDFSTQQNWRLVSYEKDHLKINYIANNTRDSIQLNSELRADKIQWVKFKDQWLLVFEYFDRLIIYNTLGLVELEMAKPESNLAFLPDAFIREGLFIFKNTVDNILYFTDRYGNLLLKAPIADEGVTFFNKPFLLNKAQNSIHVYKLNQ